jgi:hypothetical protein
MTSFVAVKPRPSVALLDLNGRHGTHPHFPLVIVGLLQTLRRLYPLDLNKDLDSISFSTTQRERRGRKNQKGRTL